MDKEQSTLADLIVQTIIDEDYCNCESGRHFNYNASCIKSMCASYNILKEKKKNKIELDFNPPKPKRCKNCRRLKSNHRANTYECPKGMRGRI